MRYARLHLSAAALALAALPAHQSDPPAVLGATKAPRRVTNGVRLPENRPRGPACAKHGVALKRVRGRLFVGGPKKKVWLCPRCVGWGQR
jgi:hypothetical protein